MTNCFMPPVTSLQFLLWSELVGMAALFFAAIHCTWGQPCVASPAYHFVTVVLACKNCQGRLDDATTKPEYEVQCGLFLNVVIAQCPAIFQLFAGKDQTLLIRGDAFFVLDFCLHIIDGVGRFNIKRDGLAR